MTYHFLLDDKFHRNLELIARILVEAVVSSNRLSDFVGCRPRALLGYAHLVSRDYLCALRPNTGR